MSVFVAIENVFFHGHKFWLNAIASANMNPMFVTEDTFHPEMSWLNVDALLNIENMFVTLLTSHPEMSWLNTDAESNMPYMFVTELTFHPEMGWLKVFLNIKSRDMSVTSEVHQLLIGHPYVPPMVQLEFVEQLWMM